MLIIEFNDKTYIIEPGIDTPEGAINPETLSNREQAELYNLLNSNLGIDSRIKKFQDGKTGTRRVIERLRDWASMDDVDDQATDQPSPEAEAPTTERKRRGMYFVFPFHGKDKMRAVRGTTSLRAQAIKLLLRGAKMENVEALVATWDQERGVASKHVDRRAYELVRLIHYHVGYGISHDQKTGVIKLHTNG